MKDIKWIHNRRSRGSQAKVPTEFFNEDETKTVRDFHRSFPGYVETPLRSLPNLANYLGVAGMYVKDESPRFGLNAFKALGGSYAIGRYLASRLNMDGRNLSFEKLRLEVAKNLPGRITFTTATDGNHGRGVAWAAWQFDQNAVVYLPKGTSKIRLDNIKATGAEALITDQNYDDTVRMVAQKAKDSGWVIVQDTAWEGYEEIPAWVMQGYTTMAAEALEQLQGFGQDSPSHVFVQAGVGSLPAAVQGYFTARYKDARPKVIVVEPDKADCMFKSALAGDGKPRKITGNMDTIMAGLACGEPNPVAWQLLFDYTDMFISCPDYVAARGMRVLGNPLGSDPRVISGESGAVTTGIVKEILQREDLQEIKDCLELDSNSKILVFSTEGDTDPANYRRIVWDGVL